MSCFTLNKAIQLLEHFRGELKILNLIICRLTAVRPWPLLWRNWLARTAVNRKVGGSSPPRSAFVSF
jgi:hypothetical protein